MILLDYTIFLFIIPIAASVYGLIPLLVCKLNCVYRAAAFHEKRPGRQKDQSAAAIEFFKRWLERCRLRLDQAGLSGRFVLPLYVTIQLGLPAVIVIIGWLGGTRFKYAFLFAILLASVTNTVINRKKKMRNHAFSRSLYKIYRFIDEQVSSGVHVTDTLRGLSEAVRDPVVRPALVRFSTVYAVTLDCEQAFAVLNHYFGGKDCFLLAVHIRQCIKSGVTGRTMHRMEELLFTRTFGMMQEDTRAIRGHLAITAALALMTPMVLFLYPLLHEAANAMHNLMG